MREIASDGIWEMKYCPAAGITDFQPKFRNGLPTHCEFIVSHRPRRGDKFLKSRTPTTQIRDYPV
jgi:hypothetical protein